MTLFTKKSVTVLSLLILFGASGHAADFYKKHGEGWFWYKDPPILYEPEEPLERKEHSPAKQPASPAARAMLEMAAFKKKLEELKVLALVQPTSENVENYMRVQKEMVDRSDRFSKTWAQVVLSNADLNPEVVSPTAQYARHVQNEMDTTHKEKTINTLSKTYGLIYFFKGNCPYCTGFAPIVKMFSEKYNWNVLAISLDGSSSDVFPEVRPDNGIATALDIQSVPALIAYNSETNDVIPISYAMSSLDQLENNVMTLVGDAL